MLNTMGHNRAAPKGIKVVLGAAQSQLQKQSPPKIDKKKHTKMIDLTKKHMEVEPAKSIKLELKELSYERSLVKSQSSRSDSSATSLKLTQMESEWESIKEESRERSRMSENTSFEYKFYSREDSLSVIAKEEDSITCLTKEANDILKSMKEDVLEFKQKTRTRSLVKSGFRKPAFSRDTKTNNPKKPQQDLMMLIQSTKKILNRN